MSSKFKPSKTPKPKPWWCHPPPWPPLPPGPPGLPAALIAYATWVDHDPLAYAHMSESFPLWPVPAPPINYIGDSESPVPYLKLSVFHSKPDYWKIVFDIYDEWRDPETHIWEMMHSSLFLPIKLIPTPDIVTQHEDYRKVTIYVTSPL